MEKKGIFLGKRHRCFGGKPDGRDVLSKHMRNMSLLYCRKEPHFPQLYSGRRRKNNTENSGKEPNRKLVVQKRRVDIKQEISLTFNYLNIYLNIFQFRVRHFGKKSVFKVKGKLQMKYHPEEFNCRRMRINENPL